MEDDTQIATDIQRKALMGKTDTAKFKVTVHKTALTSDNSCKFGDHQD